MKTAPFNSSFTTDQFTITQAILNRGFYPLSAAPELESVSLIIGGKNDVIYPQYTVVEVDEDLQSLFLNQSVGTYVLTWLLYGAGSSSSSLCFTPAPIWDLEGNVFEILQNNIGEVAQVRYISQS